MIEAAVSRAFAPWQGKPWSRQEVDRVFEADGYRLRAVRLGVRDGQGFAEATEGIANYRKILLRTAALADLMKGVAAKAPDLDVVALYGLHELSPNVDSIPFLVGNVLSESPNIIAPNLRFMQNADHREHERETVSHDLVRWQDKFDRAVYRARIPKPWRVALVSGNQDEQTLDLGLAPRIMDLTNYRKEHGTELPKSVIRPYMPIAEQMRYKCIIAMVGWEADYWKLMSGSVVVDCAPWRHWLHTMVRHGEDYVACGPDVVGEAVRAVLSSGKGEAMAQRARAKMLQIDRDLVVDYMTGLLRRLAETER